MSGPDDRPLVRVAEGALVLVTVAAVLGMQRLFDGREWLGPLVAHAVAAHVVAIVVRRRGLSLPISAAIMVVSAALVATWLSYWSTTAIGIPTGDTWSAMRTDLDAAWGLYQEVEAPAPVETGFVLASGLAIWCIAYVADWAAFRLWVPFEATLPAGTLFLFTALLGTDRGRGWAVALYAASLLGFLLLHRIARQDGSAHWVAERRASGQRSLLVVGGGLAAMAVVVGVVLGPNLPGADAAGVLDPRDINDSNDSRFTISPLVDIRARLVDQANVEVFQVRASERAYWRLTSLERFDGRIWSSSGSYGKADGDLPEGYESEATTQTIEQSYVIEALAAIWLPGAYEPEAYDGDDAEVRYDEDSATLIVDSSVPTSDGLTYDLTSSSPRLGPEDLADRTDEVPEDIQSRFTGLPEDFSPNVRQLAEQITAAATTPFEQARALQDHLRTFEYDIEVAAGHGSRDLEQFLLETRRGYCEQFAGSFAAMARAVGLPSRVAVGFTPGDVDPSDPNLYRVRGEHAHAWPEVFFADIGWVAFEPTPGRGMPAAESYTGVPEAQAAAGRPDESVAVTVPATVPGEGTTDGTVPPRTPREELDAGGGAGDAGEEDGDDSLIQRLIVGPARTILPILLAVVLTYLVAVPALLRLHRSRRRGRATTAQQRVALAWIEAVEEAGLVGYAERRSDTYIERANVLGALLPDAAEDALLLARALEAADYSAEGADDAIARLAEEASARIGEVARAAAPRPARIARWVDPRPPLRAWRAERTAQQRRITTVSIADHDQEHDSPVGVS